MHHHVRACTCLLLYLEESMVVISGVKRYRGTQARQLLIIY